MPRRKQPRPLHLDACDRLGSLLEHGVCSESGEDGSFGDEHVCGKCRLEFITLADFLQHKRLCSRKRLVLLVGEDSCDELGAEPSSPSSEDFKDDPEKYDSDMPTIPYIMSSPYEKPPYSPDSTGMPALIPAKGNQQFTDCEDQLIDLESYAKSETYANSEESFPNELKQASDNVSVSNLSPLPQYLLMQSVPDTNVTLQALQNTRVAVAQQGAGANNLSHLALHTALYTLQQQQIIQLHQVIQQLQSQLVGSSPSSSSPILQNSPTINTLTGSAALTPPQSTDGNNGGVLALTTTAPSVRSLESVTQSQNLSATVTSTATTTSCSTISEENQTTTLSSAPPPPPPHEPNTLELLQRHTEQALQNTMAGSSFLLNGLSGIGSSSDILRFCKKGDIKKEGNEEAFFRHRCRFCGKVFGSDSALQIHIRSHTGERPFKCNVCGNRFSTKGNLKVHFGRHKEKYPHIKMNPNPVPLHLDNLHPPIEPPETSETPPILTSNSTCQTVPLNLQPPNLVPAQPIPLIAHGHDKALHSPSDIATQESDRQSNDMNIHMQIQSLSPNEASNLSDDSDASMSYGTDDNGLKEAEASRYEDDIDNDDDSFSESPHAEQKDLDENAEEDSKHTISENKGSLRIARIAPSFISSSAPTFPNFFRPSLSPSFTMAPICYPPMSTPPLTSTPVSRPLISNNGNNEGNEQSGRSPDPNFYQDLLPKPGSNDNSWESLMEVTKTSETSKLQQLVDNIEHKLSDPNQCVVCHRVLSCKSALQMHYRTHTGERPFRCKICSRAFTTKGNLKTHMGVHRVKPALRVLHQCPVCHKQFTNSLVLQQHIRMHTGAPTEIHAEQIMASEVRSSHLPPTSFPRPMIPALFTNFSSSSLAIRSSPTAPPINCPPKKSSETASLASSPPTPIESVIKSVTKSKDTQILEDSSSPVTVENSSRPSSAKLEKFATPPPPILTTESHPEIISSSVTTRNISPNMDKPLVSSAPYSPAYTASLIALENHVKAINTTIPQPLPFSPFGMGFTVGGFLRYEDAAFLSRNQSKDTNSEKSPAPTHSYSPSPNTSKAGSDASGDERSTPGSIVKGESPISVHNSHLTTSVITTKTENGALDLTPKNSTISVPPSVPEIQLFPSPLTSLPFPTTPGRLSTTCRICFKTFACNSALEIHYRSHTKERPFKCTVCDRGFTTKGNMKQHLLTHKSRDLQPLLFASADNSAQDAENNLSMNVVSPCTSSPITSTNESNMSQGSNPNTDRKDSLPVTVSTISITSSTCTTNIPSVPQLISINANISPPKAIKIENESNIKRPLPEQTNGSPAKKNSGVPKHFCNTCQKPFSSASALQIHNRTHSGEKPFKCVVCGRAFTTKGNLKVHMNIHLSPQNNGTSRRGRRMSLEFQTPPPLTAHGKNDFPPPTRPELYFPYFNPGYMNGIGGPAKMNEISVIQTPASIANGNPPNSIALTPAVSMMTPVMALGQQSPFVRKHSADGESNEYADPRSPDEAENLKVQPSPSRPLESSSPIRSICSSPTSGASIEKVATWSWKTTCNLCNKICSSTSDLEVHLKSHCNPAVQDTVRSVTQTAKNAA